jgi:hypothetical protein
MKTNTQPTTHTTHEKKITPQFFFLTIGVIITLLVSSISLVNLLFASLDKLFPDILAGAYQYGYMVQDFETIRTSLSVLIIFFPTFLILSYSLHKISHKQISLYNAILRKWSLYAILFLSVLACVIDLAVLVRYFVSGEITIRFILKVIIVLCVSSISFYFYFKQLKGSSTKTHTYVLLCIASIFVMVAIAIGFFVMGSPAQQRKLQLDQRRIDDLANIQNQVLEFWRQKSRLPERIEELVDPLNQQQNLPRDPEFNRGASYEYKKIGELQFELCATFALPIPQGIRRSNKEDVSYSSSDKPIMAEAPVFESMFGGQTNESWDHQAGRTCFARIIDPELYPPLKNNEIKL